MIYIIIFVLIIGLILGILSIIEPRQAVIKTIEMTPGIPDENSPDTKFLKTECDSSLPLCNSKGIRVLFFSDLHVEFCFIKPEVITSQIDYYKPDAVIFGGDCLNNIKKTQKVISYFEPIKEKCDSLGIPLLGVTGNHDCSLTDEQIHSFGFNDIRNNEITLISNEKKYFISGVHDSGRKGRVWYQPEPCPSDCTGILVAHNPDQILELKSNYGYSYMLSGHIHGGQIRTPFRFEFRVLRSHDRLPQIDVIEGTYTHPRTGISLYISNGIGCVKLPLRLGARPDITVLDLN